MPNMNIPIDRSLLTAVSRAAQDEGLLQRDWVVKKLAEAVGWEKGAGNGRSDLGNGVGGRVSRTDVSKPSIRLGREQEAAGNSGPTEANRIKRGVDGESTQQRSEAVPQEREVRAHDPKTCRLYGCIQCKLAGVTDDTRGL